MGDDMGLRKSYKGLIIWMILFCLLCFGVMFLPIEDTALLVRIVDNICTLGIMALAFMIYKTEYVYWYTGISYGDALKAGPGRRKIYAWRHFIRFGAFAAVFLVYSVAAQLLGVSIWVDIAILTAGMVGVAVSAVRLRL